ncbi:MAG: cytochrome c3 family protein [Verrucomicrobiae bacterium]|nr:cytochrome c3 family protein [Verrucomicrobiae bacterium]
MRLRSAGHSEPGQRPAPPMPRPVNRLAHPARIRALWLFSILALAALLGCSTQTRHRWLTFFFDGVPPLGAQTNPPPAVAYDEDGRPLILTAPATTATPAAAPPYTRHPPYEDRQCTECHESRFSVRLKGTQLQICFACHDDFLPNLKVKHQPAENGDCTACHDSHGSPLPKMLTKPVPALCADCHDDPLAKGNVKHQPVENGDCAACHAAHGSAQKGLLPKPAAALCWDCHDNFLEKAAFKHQPVEDGDCASCHVPHASPHKGLLTKADPQVCFECHETADLAKVEAHRDQLEQTCSRCHDPHVGAEKFLLKPGVARPAPPATARAK